MVWTEDLMRLFKKHYSDGKSFPEFDRLNNLPENSTKNMAKKLGLKSAFKRIKKVETIKCKECNKEFISNKKDNRKFCSISCSTIYNNKKCKKIKTKRLCTKCGASVKSYRNSLCEKHQKEYLETRFEFIKELSLDDYWKRKSLENLHISSKNAHIRGLCRSWLKHLIKKPCANCGYDKHVELCHIKALKNFSPDSKLKEVNSEENVIQLCPNCHWEFDKGFINIEKIRNNTIN